MVVAWAKVARNAASPHDVDRTITAQHQPLILDQSNKTGSALPPPSSVSWVGHVDRRASSGFLCHAYLTDTLCDRVAFCRLARLSYQWRGRHPLDR